MNFSNDSKIEVVGMKKEPVPSKYGDCVVRVSMRLPSHPLGLYKDLTTHRDVACVTVTKAAYDKSVIVPGNHHNRRRGFDFF